MAVYIHVGQYESQVGKSTEIYIDHLALKVLLQPADFFRGLPHRFGPIHERHIWLVAPKFRTCQAAFSPYSSDDSWCSWPSVILLESLPALSHDWQTQVPTFFEPSPLTSKTNPSDRLTIVFFVSCHSAMILKS